jgi:hypothetical protein
MYSLDCSRECICGNSFGKMEPRRDDGLIARSVTYLFNAMSRRTEEMGDDKLYSMKASYFEIYNEQVVNHWNTGANVLLILHYPLRSWITLFRESNLSRGVPCNVWNFACLLGNSYWIFPADRSPWKDHKPLQLATSHSVLKGGAHLPSPCVRYNVFELHVKGGNK